MAANEAFSRTLIDAQLVDAGWQVSDGVGVRFEYGLSDGTRADYLLCDRDGRGLAVIEAKRSSVHAPTAADQAKHYAELAKVPFIFLANGREIWFWDYQREAHPRQVTTFYSQADLERRAATLSVRRNLLDVPIDKRVVERDYQHSCIAKLTEEIDRGRRKLLVEMATGTGKTRTAGALIKRLFDANAVTRVLFLVDRITLAKQTEDAFTEYLPELPCYVLRSGRRFDDAKRITITTLQSMVNIYRDYSAGYFDLVISDECHRSIYGKWSGVLKHFDGIQIGLTATPCYANNEDDGDDEDRKFVRDTLRFFEVDKPTFSYGMREAITDGYLVPYQIYKAKTVQTVKNEGIEVKKSELDWTAMDAETRTELEELFEAADPLIIDPAALERRFTIPERNRAIVREFREVMESGYLDGKGIQRKPIPGKTIVFAVTKRHAETLARMFDESFAAEKPHAAVRYADYVVSDTGNAGDDTLDAFEKIRRFKRDKFPQILVSVNMLDTGFDCPELLNLVFARYTRSEILYRQMRGRGTRKAPNKALFTMFDFVGVTDEFEGHEELVAGVPIADRPPRPKAQPRRLLSIDIDDAIDPSTRSWITLDADGNLTRDDAHAQRAQVLGARFEAWLLQNENQFNAEQHRWLALIGSALRANADTLDTFTADHLDVYQTFTALGGQARARSVFGGAQRLDAVLDSISLAVFSNDATDSPDTARASAPPPAQH
ncbi:DEAD/DEAH box helicase family protein [Rudaea sp.]|uniref:DEAD/DEAH box helicase family protein n=1 Tax=Rudaea sp. TaxID=2136325 RepID=UPI0037830DA1